MATLTNNGWTSGQRVVGTSVVACSTTSITPKLGLQLSASSTNSGVISVGPSTSVTTALGHKLGAGASLFITSAHGILADPSKVYAIASAASQTLSVSVF